MAEKGYKSSDIAKHLHIGRQSFYRYLDGSRFPSPDRLTDLMKLLGTTFEEITKEEEL